MNVEIQVDDKAVQRTLVAAKEAGVNLTIPFSIIAKSWFASNRSIFTLQSPGQYPDYGGFSPESIAYGTTTRREAAKRRKLRYFGFIYPMMKAKGDLERSLTNPTDSKSVNLIINKIALYLGTKVSYAGYHQSPEPRKKMPYRPTVFLGSEQIAPTEKRNEYTRILSVLSDSIQQQLDKAANA